MLALFAPIKTRLAALPALAGWGVRSVADEVPRSGDTSAEVGIVGANVGGPRTDAQVMPRLSVTLAIKRQATADAQLDAAMTAVIEALHHWMPGEQGGRPWEPLALEQIGSPEYIEAGFVGFVLVFSTSALYRGQP